MNPGQIEQVSEELADNLPVCPKCGQAPQIFKRLVGVPPRPQIAIACLDCEGYQNGIYHELTVTVDQKWHPSLFEAVNIWSLTAKLLGAETPQGVANLAGDGPPTFAGNRGCSVYTDLKTGLIYYWDSSAWLPVTNDVPF